MRRSTVVSPRKTSCSEFSTTVLMYRYNTKTGCSVFSALMLLVGRPVKNRVVGCWRGYLSGQGADLHMAQLIPLPLTISCISKIHIFLPFWYWLTRVVPHKRPLNGCVVLYTSNLPSVLTCCSVADCVVS